MAFYEAKPAFNSTCLLDMFEALQALDNTMTNVFNKIGDRVMQERQKIRSVDTRITKAKVQIEKLSQFQTSAVTVCSPSRFPSQEPLLFTPINYDSQISQPLSHSVDIDTVSKEVSLTFKKESAPASRNAIHSITSLVPVSLAKKNRVIAKKPQTTVPFKPLDVSLPSFENMDLGYHPMNERLSLNTPQNLGLKSVATDIQFQDLPDFDTSFFPSQLASVPHPIPDTYNNDIKIQEKTKNEQVTPISTQSVTTNEVASSSLQDYIDRSKQSLKSAKTTVTANIVVEEEHSVTDNTVNENTSDNSVCVLFRKDKEDNSRDSVFSGIRQFDKSKLKKVERNQDKTEKKGMMKSLMDLIEERRLKMRQDDDLNDS